MLVKVWTSLGEIGQMIFYVPICKILEGASLDFLTAKLIPCAWWGQFSFSGKWVHPYGTEVLGALDLGGASTQITFQPSGTIEDNSTKVFFRLYGTNYSIYTHSYLCYGRDQALKMLLASLSKVLITVQGTILSIFTFCKSLSYFGFLARLIVHGTKSVET